MARVKKRKRADNVEPDIPNAKRIDDNETRVMANEPLADSETPNPLPNVQKDIIPTIVSDDSNDASDGEATANKGEEDDEEEASSEEEEQDITEYIWGCRVCGEEFDERDWDAECYYHEGSYLHRLYHPMHPLISEQMAKL